MQKNLARLYSAELEGINAKLIEVEVDLNVGLHAFNIVGLADKALTEARERVNSALKNSGIKPPSRENRKITVNLAPADVKKTGAHYDLPIALGYLLASRQILNFDPQGKVFVGELALDGDLRPISGAINIAQAAREAKMEEIYLPAENAAEAAVVKKIKVIPLRNLKEAIDVLEGRLSAAVPILHRQENKTADDDLPDFSEIRGQENTKRALTIAAAGGHNMLMTGPPGVGKSLLAKALISILPDLETEEAIEITKIWSAAGTNPGGLLERRPFRSPHHTASTVSIIGGGANPRPGEISLAHRGVLFLDELPEFRKDVLEALRQPLEAGVVHVARAKGTLIFPAKFSLIAAMNPCPCGFYGDPEKECRCSAYEVIRYSKKISGPLLDRIDLQVRVPRLRVGELRLKNKDGVASAEIKKQVETAREIQRRRFQKLGSRIQTNSEMNSKQTEAFSNLNPEAEEFLKTLDRSQLSPRGYYRLLKTARTIADLEESVEVKAEHLAEAFSYRQREEI